MRRGFAFGRFSFLSNLSFCEQSVVFVWENASTKQILILIFAEESGHAR